MLNYADFDDYRQIIEKYKKLFGNNIDDFISYLRAVYVFRNKLMHSRKINYEDYTIAMKFINVLRKHIEERK